MRRALTAVAALCALPAGAQAADLGGGTVPDSVERHSRSLTLVAIRTFDDDRARVGVKVSTRCGLGEIARTVTPAADGAFSFTGTVRSREGGVRETARMTVSGQVVGGSATGTATARLTYRRGGRVVGRCRSGARTWQARAAVAEPTAAPPHANGAYHGLTAQSNRPFPFLLRVDPAARRVRTAVFEYRQRCDESRPFEWENVTPGARIGADGAFHLRERFTQRWRQGVERYRIRVDGRFTTTGVSGTLSVSSVLRSSSGRVVDRCRTGRQGFAAVL